MEDSYLPESETHDDFIILPSQEESQLVVMKEAVKNLPALKGTDLIEHQEMQEPLDPSTGKQSDRGSSPIVPECTNASQSSITEPMEVKSLIESSVQAKQGTNLGNYDECAKPAPKASRFLLIPASQEDMFDNDEQEDDARVLTPAEHIGSLQLSQHPMIVPETEDDTDTMIPPSPDAYSNTPMIIPNSPTQGDEHEDPEEDHDCDTDYDVTIMNTFTDKPKRSRTPEDMFVDEQQRDSSSSPTEPGKEQNMQSVEVSTKDFQAGLDIPTLQDDERPESLHLHLTESTQASHISAKGDVVIDLSSSSSPEVLPSNNRQSDSVPRGQDGEGAEDIIVIQSETMGSLHHEDIDGSQNLSLHLSPTQENNTQRSGSAASKSQPEKSQSHRSQGSTGENSQGSRSHKEKVRKRRLSKEEALIADVNATPLVVWKDLSDTERKLMEEKSSKPLSSEKFEDFHLSIPKDTPTEPPDVKIPSDYSPPGTTHDDSAQDDWTDRQEEGPKTGTDESLVELDEEVSIRRALTIRMVESDSEACSQTVFKLDRPNIEGDSEEETNDTEDMFARKKVSKPKPIQEDSDDEEPAIVSSMLTNYDASEEMFVATKLYPNTKGSQNQEDNTESYSPEGSLVTEVKGDKSGPLTVAGIVSTDDNIGGPSRVSSDTTIILDPQEKEVTKGINSGYTSILLDPQGKEGKEGTSVETSILLDCHGKESTNDINPNGDASMLKEMATQTPHKDPDGIEVVDSVVLKVTEYLQTGLAPRSRASSVCTDWSGSHPGDGSEKGETGMKSPTKNRKDSTDSKKSRTPSLQRSISEKHKSPEEVKHILETYSNILSKRRRKKSGESRHEEEGPTNSQRPNPASESPIPAKILNPRRLSSQSLPADLSSSKTDKDNLWMSSRKADSQLSVNSDLNNTGAFIPSVSQARSKETRAKKSLAMDLEQSTSALGQDSKQIFTDRETASRAGDMNVNIHVTRSRSCLPLPDESLTKHNVTIEDQAVNITHLTTDTVKKLPCDNQNLSAKKRAPKLSLDITNDSRTVATTGSRNNRNGTGSRSIPTERDDDGTGCISPSSQSSQRMENSGLKALSPVVRLTNLSHLTENKTPIIIDKRFEPNTSIKSSQRLSRRKQKYLKSSSKRNALLKGSPNSQSSSGQFTNSTQRFQAKKSGSPDLYTFHGSQSQISPQQQDMLPTTNSPTRKRKLLHRKSGLKKQKLTAETWKQHVSFKSSSQQSDVTMTTSSGSCQSVPSTISHRSSCLEPILSPSSSGSRQSVVEEISSRLSGKRLSVEQSLQDTLPLHHSEEDNYQKVTIVTETVEKLYREITTIRKVVGEDGTVLESTEEVVSEKRLQPGAHFINGLTTKEVKNLDPVTVEENTHKRVQFIYIPSPSRSVTSLTSGDLADISSSMSKSSMSSGSLGLKVSMSSSTSQEHGGHKDSVCENNKSVASNQSKPGTPPAVVENQSRISMKNQSKSVTPVVSITNQSTSVTPAIASTSAMLSDQEASDMLTPLGSTINKTGSHLHESTNSIESPAYQLHKGGESTNNIQQKGGKSTNYTESPAYHLHTQGESAINIESVERESESLFSSSEDKQKHATRAARKQEDKSSRTVKGEDTEDKSNSREIPHQVQSVSSSSLSECGHSLVTSAGTVGSRIIAKWKDGFYYPGTLKSSIDRYSKCQVVFDDGDRLSVKVQDILLIDRLPTGQSVMVLTDDGDFECGLIQQQTQDHYKVETDSGVTGSYSLSQVILSSDQASFLVSDRGSSIMLHTAGQTGGPAGPANVGDVSLDNLVDTPRRRLKETPGPKKLKDQPPEESLSSRGRKRKMDVLKPQATSTPTPKGKSEGATKRRKVERTYETSPIAAASQVPEKRSPRKTKVGLFRKAIGPLPTKKLFKGLNVLLTNVEKSREQINQEKKLLKPTSLDISTDESSQEDDGGAPFDKNHLTAQIEAGGGTLIDNFNEKLIGGKKRCVLISSTYQRTIKFLQCLAAGMPCLSHMWIVDSCSQNQLLDEKSYTLPAGISLEKRKLMEWKSKGDVFVGVKAIVHSKDSHFVETWTNILQLSKCQVLDGLPYAETHVIVTDRSCLSTVERQANNKHVPLVSTEWVIQSLINGKTVTFTGHPRYQHDCVT